MFGLLRQPGAAVMRPDKGHSSATLSLVLEAVTASSADVSASDMAEAVGISRATAQRYLSYLERRGAVTLSLRYGSTGRPEHRYRATR